MAGIEPPHDTLERGQPPEPDADGTEIVYVPGAENHYKYDHDVIVLDERLQAYPKAHEYIKNHELEHATHGGLETGGLLALLRLEWRTDLDHYFADDETIAEVREYFEERRERERIPPLTAAKHTVVDLLRGTWDLALRPLSWAYWRVKG
ncbi:hypothetical protein [Natrinema pallidum]|uniref:Uncharacterized protein n=1 Tax=Natrinema pallidum TaxID=69527 RepID=A0A4P9TLZ4_9EURY|nr:hypothetical protein [Natrinema pallidum]QCW05245.1 hypothetical protein FGF80_18525 [Natrinema pallidum]